MKLAMKNASPTKETPFVERVLRPTSHNSPIVEKKSAVLSRYERRKAKDRLKRFEAAVEFAYAMDWPLNIGITITWTALHDAGEHNEGHCLAREEWAREQYLRDELARLCRSEGLTFAALWGRDIGAAMGTHVHLAMYWPSSKLAKLIAVLERLSGSNTAFALKPYAGDVVARSVCGGWQINMNNRSNDKAGARDWAAYIAGQHSKHAATPAIKGKAFGISEAISKEAQQRAKPMLDEREATYGWLWRA